MPINYHRYIGYGPHIPTKELDDNDCTAGTLRYDHYFGYWGVPGLAQALMMRVGTAGPAARIQEWCFRTRYHMYHQGEWAGDRFDIRVFDEVSEHLSLDRWIGLTEEVAKDILHDVARWRVRGTT
ncbi:hypothetical protein M413DRAFT_29902 [Hebeloma cylindrosporum]|uniref:Uncharacterized protein n=1 Tax=Hebeloma cylindrosporum TaxID=76867 RepID=A0A0C2YCF2_HEBCY|nr:hypothetical protein M413DRAFT_29902 [Hebeloma cylindrosporum h7]